MLKLISNLIFTLSVVNQYYDPNLMPTEYVMRGNAAILKCSIPSFVADFVHVVAWVDEEGVEVVASDDFSASEKAWNAWTSKSSFSFLFFIPPYTSVRLIIFIFKL